MAPETLPNLVLLDLEFENDEPLARVWMIERSFEARSRGDHIYVSWNIDRETAGFFALGDGAIHIRKRSGIERFSYTAKPDAYGGSRYGWRYGIAEPLMVVLVFPKGYIATDFEPSPLRAKATQSGRLAAYWIFQGIDKGDAAD